jgi:hypothetical protein
MEDLPYEELFANNMWNSPNTQIPLVVWKGGEQGLSIFLPQYETPLDFFFLFGPTNILKSLCHDQHLCHPRVGRRRCKRKGELGMIYHA